MAAKCVNKSLNEIHNVEALLQYNRHKNHLHWNGTKHELTPLISSKLGVEHISRRNFKFTSTARVQGST